MTDASKPVDLADLRRRLGEPGKPISQSELARRLGCHQTTVMRIENGSLDPTGVLAMFIRKVAEEAQAA